MSNLFKNELLKELFLFSNTSSHCLLFHMDLKLHFRPRSSQNSFSFQLQQQNV